MRWLVSDVYHRRRGFIIMSLPLCVLLSVLLHRL
jgi:hypothetical protein